MSSNGDSDYMEPEEDYIIVEDQDQDNSQTFVQLQVPIIRPQVWTQHQLFDILRREIKQKIVDLFPALTTSQALAMLLQNNFNFEQIQERLCNWSLNHICKQYNLPADSISLTRECDVCMGVEKGEEITCCNSICMQCLHEYIRNQVQAGTVLLRCPVEVCNAIIYATRIPPNLLQRYEEKVGVLYSKSVPHSYIKCWDCGDYIKIPRDKQAFIPCAETCACRMCQSCENISHRPLKCDEVAKWTEKIMNQGLSEEYIKKNTKRCPKCHVNIEKNEGCNHMTCRMCKHEFCWICMGDWKAHCEGKIKCVVYVEKGDTLEELDRNKFVFYCTRYMEFDKSEHMAFKTRKNLMGQRMKTLSDILQKPLEDFEFLRQGLNCIIQGRRSIKFMYAFLCMGKINKIKKEMIEHNLGMAQLNLEFLHGLVESVINSDTIGEWDMYLKMSFQIKNYSSVTDKFLQNVADQI